MVCFMTLLCLFSSKIEVGASSGRDRRLVDSTAPGDDIIRVRVGSRRSEGPCAKAGKDMQHGARGATTVAAAGRSASLVSRKLDDA